MLDKEWTLFKFMYRRKYAGKPEKLAQLEEVYSYLETVPGKLDVRKWKVFTLQMGKAMTQEEKEAILLDTKAEMAKQGIKKGSV
jgi:hypothetical protein